MAKFTVRTVKGKGRGKTIVGFPTFNLETPNNFEAKEGVYACCVEIEGKRYRGALHYGPTPTFDDQEKVLEIFVLNYEDKSEVKDLSFELGPYLRPVATFIDPTALRNQIALDVARVRKAAMSQCSQ